MTHQPSEILARGFVSIGEDLIAKMPVELDFYRLERATGYHRDNIRIMRVAPDTWRAYVKRGAVKGKVAGVLLPL